MDGIGNCILQCEEGTRVWASLLACQSLAQAKMSFVLVNLTLHFGPGMLFALQVRRSWISTRLTPNVQVLCAPRGNCPGVQLTGSPKGQYAMFLQGKDLRHYEASHSLGTALPLYLLPVVRDSSRKRPVFCARTDCCPHGPTVTTMGAKARALACMRTSRGIAVLEVHNSSLLRRGTKHDARVRPVFHGACPFGVTCFIWVFSFRKVNAGKGVIPGVDFATCFSASWNQDVRPIQHDSDWF